METYDIRVELEGLGARIGMRHLDEAAVARIGDVLEEMGQELDSPADWMKLNDEFHMILYQASEMVQLCDIIWTLMMKTRPYQFAYLSLGDTLETTHLEHPPLFEAIRAGDAGIGRRDHACASASRRRSDDRDGVDRGADLGDARRRFRRRPASCRPVSASRFGFEKDARGARGMG